MQIQTPSQSPITRDTAMRAFAARLDMTLKRARVSTSRVARYVGVPEQDVAMWRAGVTAPERAEIRRLSEMLQVDFGWLKAGGA